MDIEFSITPDRLAMAKRVVAEKARRLEQNQLYDVMDEIGWSDMVTFGTGGGGLQFILTDLQIVMLAAGLAAVVEAGAKQHRARKVENDPRDIPF